MLAGSIVALVTPMHRSGEVDWAALDRLIDWHVESGTHGIVPMGTTGESRDAHRRGAHQGHRADRRARRQADSGDRGHRRELHGRSDRIDAQSRRVGADACLLVTPYYNKPTQEGLYQHYKAIAAAVDVPQLLYNVPGRTACDMKAETVGRLAAIDNIIGIKEACGDVAASREIRECCAAGFVVLSGEDAQTLDMMKLGAVGTISVTANVLPREMSQFVSAFLEGDNRAPRKSMRGCSRFTRSCSSKRARSRSSGRCT